MIAVELVPMLIVLQLIATLTATLFAGAALYIHVAEHPARMTLDAKAAALQWADSYRRATWVQAPLAVLSFASGMAAWLLTFDAAWLVAAVLIGAVVPFTLVVVMPTNRQLLDSRSDRTGAETRTLLQKWNRLHAARTAFGMASSLIYLWSLRPP